MADKNIKKVVIKNSELPSISFDDDGLYYAVRYRVISEDRNRSSAWSSIYRLAFPPTSDAGMPYGTTDPERFNITKYNDGSSTVINSTWNFKQDNDNPTNLEKVLRNLTSFDIWIRWNPNNAPDDTAWEAWQYITEVGTNTFSILKRTDAPVPKQIEIAVQIPTLVKERDSRLTLFLGKHNI